MECVNEQKNMQALGFEIHFPSYGKIKIKYFE